MRSQAQIKAELAKVNRNIRSVELQYHEAMALLMGRRQRLEEEMTAPDEARKEIEGLIPGQLRLVT